jgi:hypothetical protein
MSLSMKMEIPTGVREYAEISITQAEKAFDTLIGAANSSAARMPQPAANFSMKALSFTEQSTKSTIDYARKLLLAKDLKETAQLQTEFLEVQFAAMMRLLGTVSVQTTNGAKQESSHVSTGPASD